MVEGGVVRKKFKFTIMNVNTSPSLFLLASISSLKAELERIKIEKGQVSFMSFKFHQQPAVIY